MEGVWGLLRGFIPSLMLQVANLMYIIFFLNEDDLRDGTRTSLQPGVFGSLGYSRSLGWIGSLLYVIPVAMVSLPQVILAYRAISTPDKLPTFNALHSVRVLLTPTERRCPWILFRTPGLLAALMLHIAYDILFPRTLRIILLSRMLSIQAPWSKSLLPFSVGRLVVWFLNGTNLIDVSVNMLIVFNVEAFLTAVLLTPVEVILVRLAIQRNDAVPELDSSAQEEDIGHEITVEYSGAEEDVIELRVDREPYRGVIDCAKCIVTEEGWYVLYRGWWLTMIGRFWGINIGF